MITYEFEDLEHIDISMVDRALLSDLGGSTEGYSLYLVRGYDDDMPARSTLQIIYSDRSCRAGVVLIEDETSGRADWMNAYSPADALDLYLGNERTVWFREGAPLWRTNLGTEMGGGDVSIPCSTRVVGWTASDEILEIWRAGAAMKKLPNPGEGRWDTAVPYTSGA